MNCTCPMRATREGLVSCGVANDCPYHGFPFAPIAYPPHAADARPRPDPNRCMHLWGDDGYCERCDQPEREVTA